MDNKRILKSMTKGKWDVMQDAFTLIHVDKMHRVGECQSRDKEQDLCNAFAITTAVNSTYGKGYDPTKMDEMYKKLDSIAIRFTGAQMHEEATEIFLLLQSASLTLGNTAE